jgi:hypothetical protein
MYDDRDEVDAAWAYQAELEERRRRAAMIFRGGGASSILLPSSQRVGPLVHRIAALHESASQANPANG